VSPRAPAPSLRVVARAPDGRDVVDELRLVTELRRGRLDALARAYDRWHERVRVLARRLLGDDAAAEDVVQEVFSALPLSARRYRGEGGLGAFLMGMAVKRSRHHRRAALKRRRALERWGATARLGGAATTDPERDAYRRQLAERLARALDRLPHPQRVAFVLCDVEGLTAGEAATIADVPEGTVRTRAFHARRKLRDLLVAEHKE